MWDYYSNLKITDGNLLIKDFLRGSLIDKSNYDVFQVKNRKTKQYSALKIFNLDKFEDFQRELNFYLQNTHNYIVKFHGYCIGQDNDLNKTGFIFMELGIFNWIII